jgi:hypothetical protein
MKELFPRTEVPSAVSVSTRRHSGTRDTLSFTSERMDTSA